jgi:hypothetical protein
MTDSWVWSTVIGRSGSMPESGMSAATNEEDLTRP